MEGDNKIEDMEAVQKDAAILDVEQEQPIIFPWEVASGTVKIDGVNVDTQGNDNDEKGESLDECTVISIGSRKLDVGSRELDTLEFNYAAINKGVSKRKSRGVG